MAEEAEGGWAKPSKSQEKRDATAMQELGMELLALPAKEMHHFTIPDDVLEALQFARSRAPKLGDALRRQKQRIGSLMGEMDLELLREELRRYRAQASRPRPFLIWTERLLADDQGMTAFCDEFPDADHRRVRQLVRNVTTAKNEAKRATATKVLRQNLKEILAPTGPG